MEGAPGRDDLKAWLGLRAEDTYDDKVLEESLAAARGAQARVCLYPVDVDTGEAVCPPELREALFLRAQRLAARRNSPEGVVGIVGAGGDFVPSRVAAYDADVEHLEGPYRRQVVA